MIRYTLSFFRKSLIIHPDEPIIPEVKPLTLRNVGIDSADVSITKIGTPTVNGLYYRIEGEESWLPYTIDTNISVKPNEAVQFQNTNEILNTDFENYTQFVIPSGTKFNAEGNIQSMLNYSDSASAYCFYKLFYMCSGLVDASQLELPATTLATYCYLNMFNGCTSLVNAPELQATTLAEYCYSCMFYSCTSLTTAPELQATTLADNCYLNMFNGCTSLTTAPELQATTLAEYCYSYMFKNCTNLKEIKAHFTVYNDGALNNWVEGVSSTGTFYKLSELPEEFGTYRIPKGWTVVNFDEIRDLEGGDWSSELKFTLAGSKYNRGIEGGEYILNGEYVETEDSKTSRNGSFDNCVINAVNKNNSDYTIQIQIVNSSSSTFGTGIKACYVNAPEGIVYEVSSMFGYILFNYNDEKGSVSLTLTSNDSTLNSTAAFKALQTKFLNQ